MKGFLIICLIHTTLWVKIVFSLECYVCLTPTPSDQCTATRNCSAKDNWCFSTVYGPTESGYPFRGDRNVIQDCAEKCKPSNPNYLDSGAGED
ncbi:ly6/PLAUR domain-containing protein 2-like [Spea bombifrons]|uniref:ly6/PLAUR domain-containing protein 2-like n=1 Tax=Spea bombifrons TaxID=233779 RepID=UPI00234A00BF|nr:ly6/PLAUR domain-containing protein 2-like [Spea bombifrons]